MANNLTLSVTLTGDGRQLSGTLKDARNDVREFGTTTERESRKADTALTAPGRSAVTVSEHLRDASREARTFGTETAQGGREASQALSQTSGEAQTVTGHLDQLRTVAAGVGVALATIGARDFVMNAYAAVSSSQQLQGSLKTVTGSIENASAAWDTLLGFAAETPFTLDQSVQAFIRMQSLGLNPSLEALRSYGNTASAMGKDMMQMVEAVADATTGEFERLKEFGIRASKEGEQISFTFQGVTTTVANSVAAISQYLQQIGENQFAGAMGDQMDTLSGKASNLEDTIYQFYLAVGDAGAADIFESTLANASNTVQFLTDNIDTLATGAEVMAVLIGGRVVVALANVTASKVLATQQTIAYQLALARMAGVSGTAAAAQTALAGATRAASGAMMLLGGPAGAVALAGLAIYTFRDELGLTIPQIDANTTAVNQLTNGLDDMNQAAAQLTLTSLVGQLAEVRAQAEVTAEAFTKVGQIEGDGGGGFLGVDVTAQTNAVRELGETSNATQQEAANLEAAIALVESRIGQLGERNREVTPTVTEIGDASETAAAKAKEMAKAASEQADAIEALRNRMIPHRQETVQLAQDQNTLNLAFAMGRVSAADYLSLMGALQQSYMEVTDTSKKAADQISVDVSTWTTISENGIRRVDDAGVDLWLRLADGSRNAMDTVKRGIQQSLAEIAHMLTTQRLTVAIAGSLGFNTGGAGGMGGVGSGGGFGISPGSVGNMWNALQGGLGGIQWGGVPTAYSGGWAGSATAGMGASGGTSFMGGSLRNFSGMQGLAGLGAGLAGNWLGGQLFGQGKHSSTLGTIGGAVGTYFGGPLGALAGSTLGSALGGIFGGSWETKDAGLNLGVSAGDITGNQYENQRKSGGWFSSSKSRTRTSALNSELEAMLQDAYAAQEASLAVTLETLGQQSSALNAFSSGLTRISTKGLDEAEVEQAVQEWLQNVVNSAAQSVTDPSQYARAGETTVDTLSRLATALNGINPILEQLHENSLAASLAGGDAASHLAELAGGIDAFSARADYYYQNVLTEAERQERAMDAAAQSMGAFTARTGRVIESTDALRELVDGIDLTTVSGRELYNQAMNLAPALVEIERGLERVGQQFEQMLADASAVVSDAEAQVRRAYQVFDGQQFDMQLELLALMGDAEGALALERERELASIDESLRPMRERIWAMQDEAEAQQRATQAAQGYIRELTRVRDQLSQQLGSIGNWLDQQMATSSTPQVNLATAQEQFARQLVRAENGDRDALQSITQYAQQVLDANRDYNASSPAGQRIEQDVFSALKDLPKALSDAEFIVEGFRGIVTDEMAREIERAIFASQYTIDALIDFAADASALPQDLRTILGEQAHRLDSTLNYLLGENQLDSELRQLALASSNNLVATVDYIARRQLSDGDKRLALSSSNTMSAVIDYVVRSELDRESKRLALESSNAYSAMINMILGRDITADDRTLALDSANRYTTLVDYVVRAELTGGNRRLALSSLNEYQTLIDYATRADVSSDDRKLALTSGNRYLSTLDYIVGKNIDDGSKEIALSSSNRYLTTVNIVLGSNISSADRRLALDSTNRYDAVIRYVVDAPLTGGDRRLALSAGQQYEALIGYYVNKDISKNDRTLALNSANRYLTNVEFIVGRDISSSDRRLALNSNNRYVSTIDQLIGKQVTGGDRRLALNSTNAYLTTVDAVLKRGISADVRTFGLANSNAIMTTVDGILASGMSGDVRTLALKSSNRFVTTLEAVLKDGRITGDERKLLDARSADVIKTLKTSGSLNLTQDEWAVINAASGTQRLQLLADVAFGRTDLDKLDNIDDNTKPLAEQARDQLKELNGLVSEMMRSTDQFVGLNSTMISLRESINALGVAQNEIARIEQERVAAEKAERARIERERIVTQRTSLTNDINRLQQEQRGLSSTTVDAPDRSVIKSNYQHVPDAIQTINGFAELFLERQGVSQNAADRLRAYFTKGPGYRADQGVGDAPGEGGAYSPGGMYWPYVQAYINEIEKAASVRQNKATELATQIAELQMELKSLPSVNGSHRTGLEYVPFDGYLAELHRGEKVLTAEDADAMRNITIARPAPLPSFPLLRNSDIVETLRDLKREVAELRRDNARLQGESNKHLAAANNQRGAAATQQIAATERGNKMLKKMEDDKRLEAAKR